MRRGREGPCDGIRSRGLSPLQSRAQRLRDRREVISALTYVRTAHAVCAVEDALHNLGYRPMALGGLGGIRGFTVRADDIRQQVPSLFFSDNLAVSESEKKRLADAEGGGPVHVVEPCGFWHDGVPFDRQYPPLDKFAH
jgi:hypothetical protein